MSDREVGDDDDEVIEKWCVQVQTERILELKNIQTNKWLQIINISGTENLFLPNCAYNRF
jgi:hypothetical protein